MKSNTVISSAESGNQKAVRIEVQPSCLLIGDYRNISMRDQPKITVGILDQQTEISGRLNGYFSGEGLGLLTGEFSAMTERGSVVFKDATQKEIIRSPYIKLKGRKGSSFLLFDVTIGNQFHWEKKEDQTFRGDLILQLHNAGSMAVINEISLEDYLKSVISSEMSGMAPMEFLKAHAILSRSWLLSALDRKKKGKDAPLTASKNHDEETIRWYDRETHDLFDVCADDHCQRYQGILKIVSKQAEEAVRETYGKVIAFQDEICDARYSKACGGITENFDIAWEDKQVPYLRSIPDSSVSNQPVRTEEEASKWIFSSPDAYCNTRDEAFLQKILPDFDQETKDFFRWTVEYSRKELEEILREKSGFDFGTLKEIVPLRRGPSGRIARLRIVGSKKSVVVGKELEIRRWLSQSHLYSSAIFVTVNQNSRGEAERFVFHGAGWGHGVGLCQIGAAVMASKGFSAEEILKHYFRGVEIKKFY
jgi:peptidoglycan hydrolase-like amidase